MAEPAVFYYPASKTGCFMASIHMYLLSLSTCTADRQLSSSGVLLFSSRFSLAIALQKLLCARQVVRDLKPTEKAPYPRAMAGFLFVVLFNTLWFSSLTTEASALPRKPSCTSTERALAAASR